MATDQEFRDLGAVVATLRRDLRESQDTINLWRQNGLGHLDSGSGKWRFGSNLMQLDNYGMQVALRALDTQPESVASIRWLLDHVNDRTTLLAGGYTYPYAMVNGQWYSGTSTIHLNLSANYSSGSPKSYINLRSSAGGAASIRLGVGSDALTVIYGASFPLMSLSGLFTLYSRADDDHVNGTPGNIGYNSALAAFRGFADGATRTFLMSGMAAALGSPLTIPDTLTPATITSDQNDYAPTGIDSATVLRLASDASWNITGLAVTDAGRTFLVVNVGSFDIVLKDENAGSTSVYRFALDGDITLAPDTGAVLWYDTITDRWRCAGRYSAGGGAGDVATDTIWDALGDLAVGTGANTANNLPVGTDGYVLTADSTDLSFGIKWAPAAGGPGGSTSIARTLMLMGA